MWPRTARSRSYAAATGPPSSSGGTASQLMPPNRRPGGTSRGRSGDGDVLVGHAVRHPVTGDVPRAVLAEVGRALLLLLGERLRLQRGEVADVVRRDAQALTDPLAELVLAHEEVPDHALLDLAVALLQR